MTFQELNKAQPKTTGEVGSKETVTVACKLPHGIVMRVQRIEKTIEQSPMGPRETTIYRPDQTQGQYIIRGYIPKYDPDSPPPISMGSRFAYTDGIPKEIWDRWLEQNADADMVKNGLIFAFSTRTEAKAEGARREPHTTSGLEPMNPKDLKGGKNSVASFDGKEA